MPCARPRARIGERMRRAAGVGWAGVLALTVLFAASCARPPERAPAVPRASAAAVPAVRRPDAAAAPKPSPAARVHRAPLPATARPPATTPARAPRASTSRAPVATAAHAPPQARAVPPLILSVGVSPTVVHGGSVVHAVVRTNASVVSVTAFAAGQAIAVPQVGPALFAGSTTIPPLPPFVHGSFGVTFVARDARGASTQSGAAVSVP